MNENIPPNYLPVQSRPSGMGCFAKGCLVVIAVLVLLAVMIGGFGWYVARNVMPFASQQAAAIRVFPATDAQYQAVLEKVAPFVQAVHAGHAATLALSADDINILVARDPQFARLRGKVYLSINHNELSTDASYPIGDERSGRQGQVYLNGRIVFDASFANGEFTVVLRRVEPPGGGETPGMVAWMVGNKNFSANFTRSFNESFREGINQNPAAAEFLDHLQTVIVRDNQIVATALESPTPVATPANPP